MGKNTSLDVWQIHDHFFRISMSDLRVARDFLGGYLSSSLLEEIKLETIQLRQESYVDKDLKLLSTDILYSVERKNSDESAYIYILIEHLSASQELAPWRMLQYTCRIIEQHLRKNPTAKQLPLVIPLVVYNGKVKYSAATSIFELFSAADKKLAQDYMFTQFQLIDYNQIPDEVMRQHHWSCLMELLMKHIWSRDLMNILESLTEVISNMYAPDTEQYILGMLKYVMEKSQDRDENRFREFLQQCSTKNLEEKAMTLAELWESRGIEKGIQQGREQGIEQGLQLGKEEERFNIAKKLLQVTNDLKFIQQITGLDVAEIQQLQKEMETVQ